MAEKGGFPNKVCSIKMRFETFLISVLKGYPQKMKYDLKLFNQPWRVFLKGTVCLISSEPPCKDRNTRIKMVSLKPLSDRFSDSTSVYFCEFLNWLLKQGMRRSLSQRNRKWKNRFKETKKFLSNSYLIRQAFKGTVVNRTLSSLHWGPLEITFTVPLSFYVFVHTVPWIGWIQVLSNKNYQTSQTINMAYAWTLLNLGYLFTNLAWQFVSNKR